eukprot:TRINITY_DN5777_c0_g1_i3.p1 TRINITY_DN5777_c0_g1~~TRINITY_DN5777_c0_g1_i3.p1  ORF type:complete len:364 (+),score=44.96 TRINITY_DN5777_c0_g1_i3:206-1297(+)
MFINRRCTEYGGGIKRCHSHPGYVTFCMSQVENSMKTLTEIVPEAELHKNAVEACPDQRFEGWPDTDDELDLELNMSSEIDTHPSHWQQLGVDSADKNVQETVAIPLCFCDSQRKVLNLEAALRSHGLPPMSNHPPTITLARDATKLFLPRKACSPRSTSANLLVPEINGINTAPLLSTSSGSPLSTNPQSRMSVPGFPRALPVGGVPKFFSEDSDSELTLAWVGSMTCKHSGTRPVCSMHATLSPKPPGPLPVGLRRQSLHQQGSNRETKLPGDFLAQQTKATAAACLRRARAMLPATSGSASAHTLKPTFQSVGPSTRPRPASNKEKPKRFAPVLLGAKSTENSDQCPHKSIVPVGLLQRA